MKTILFLFPMLLNFSSFGQQKVPDTAWLKGRISSEVSGPGVFDIGLPQLRRYVRTDALGQFAIGQVPMGNYMLVVYGGMQQSDTFRIAVDLDTTDLGELPVNGSGMALTEAEQFSAALLVDPATESPEQTRFADPDNPLDIAARAWSALGYRFRAYDRDQVRIYMNGMPVQDLESGTVAPGLWAGVNNMVSAIRTVYGLQYGADSYGSQAGSTSFLIRAADQRRQTRFSYSRSNGIWSNNLMLSHSTGTKSNGWAAAWSAGKCWSRKGYVPGTSYDAYSFYLGISRRLSKAHSLHFTALATPVESGNTSAVTAEAITLAGTPYYNPNWGMQEDRIRNARMSKSLQPFFQINYCYQADSTTSVNLVAGYRSGYSTYSSPDWYNAPDPRPDYYKNLPSAYKDDPATAAQVTQEWLNNPDKQQLNWDRMYEANRLNADTLNQYRSVYTLGADRIDTRQYTLAMDYRKRWRNSTWQSGATYERQYTRHYRQMLDLLGGDYYVNINQFAEQAYTGNTMFNQNDLNQPDRRVYTGDSYGYDYEARHMRATVWSQLVVDYKKICLSFAGHLKYTTYHRDGQYRTGMFPTDSYGSSAVQYFFTYLAKAGVAYRFRKEHHLFLNAGIYTASPAFESIFISPKSRNTALEQPVTARAISAEAGYRVNMRRLKGNLTVFLTDRDRITDTRRFYHEAYKSFVNYVMEGISIQHMGLELALQATITKFLSATAALAWHQAVYDSRPTVSVYKDNDTALRVDRHTAYLKGYYTAGPQSALLLGLNFRLPAYAYAGIRCRLLDRNYVDVNPARRTDAAVGLTLPGSAEQERILHQERLPGAFVMDLSAGKTFYLRKTKDKMRYAAIFVRGGVSNMLNNKSIIADAYEQLRFDYTGQDPERFPNKYSYAYGAVYTLELGFRF